MTALLLPLLLLPAGCAGAEGESAPAAVDTGWSTSGASSPSTTSPPGTTTEPAWYGVGGTLQFLGGAPVGGTLDLALYGADPAEGPLCEESRPLQGVSPSSDPLPDPALLGWWLLVTDPPGACAGLSGVGSGIYLGLGELHPEIAARLDAYGMEELAGSLYGLYAGFSADATGAEEVVVFGFAGRLGDLSSGDPAVDQPPLPDGPYVLTPVFVFSLDQQMDAPSFR